ncbi:MAG: solute carrier family 23 protein [Desulfuromonadaceae bacterium]|nr:solute carrier family 23 protein [Desulfuromonas sp.]MDY0185617.1 solute carrier family 23 protein [Desulfuromonadaceae bacterium]
MNMHYNLDDRPPLGVLLLYGLQWLAISVPTLVILSQVITSLQTDKAADAVSYLQMMLLITGATQLVQVLWGHKLPLILGPAAVLLVGALASTSAAPGAVPTAMLIGGTVMFIAAVSGLFGPLQRLFTPQVVAVVLLLIAFTLLPTISNLILPAAVLHETPLRLGFSLGMLILLFALQPVLRGLWKSTLVVWAMLGGTLVWKMLAASAETAAVPAFAVPLQQLKFSFVFDPGVVAAFLVCYMVLVINDIGSMQALDQMLKPANMPQRLQRGLTVTALANVVSGLAGVLGPVNYSMSPGVIAASRCASRWTLVPAGIGMMLCGFSPRLTAMFSAIPSVVIGTVLLYVLCAQVATGLMVVYHQTTAVRYEHGLSIGLAVLVGTSVAYLPPEAVNTLPQLLRPMLGNGFVVGVLLCLMLEHLVFRKR